MKKLYAIIAIIMVAGIALFPYIKKERNHENVSITISDSDDEFEIEANFPKSKAQEIHEFLDAEFNQNTFKKAEIDADIRLSDKTFFYAKSSETYLNIELDKDKNTKEALQKMKKIGKGVKDILAK